MTGSSHPFAGMKQQDPTEPSPTNTEAPGIIWGGKEAHPLSAGEDEAIITGAKDGKHQLTQPQLRSPVRRAIDGEYTGNEEEGQKNHPTPRRRRG